MQLLVSAGETQVSFLIYAKNPFVLHGLIVFDADEDSNVETFSKEMKAAVAADIVLKNFTAATVFFSGSESLAIPDSLYDAADKERYPAMMYGEGQGLVFEECTERGYHIVFRQSEAVLACLRSMFAEVNFRHELCSPAPAAAQADSLACFVSNDQLQVTLHKNNELLYTGSFAFSSAVDACYHLLNICERYRISPESIELNVSGFMTPETDLSPEFSLYFPRCRYESLPESIMVSGKLKDEPRHFFSKQARLALCV